MGESYITPFGHKCPMPWRSYVWRVLIGHALVLIGWPIIAFLTTGNWLHEWPLGVATATIPAVSLLVWGYFRKTKPRPVDPKFDAKLRLFGEIDREDIGKYEDLL
jgi:hypothetical protein